MNNTHTPNLTTHFSLLYDLYSLWTRKELETHLQYLTSKSDKTKIEAISLPIVQAILINSNLKEKYQK